MPLDARFDLGIDPDDVRDYYFKNGKPEIKNGQNEIYRASYDSRLEAAPTIDYFLSCDELIRSNKGCLLTRLVGRLHPC